MHGDHERYIVLEHLVTRRHVTSTGPRLTEEEMEAQSFPGPTTGKGQSWDLDLVCFPSHLLSPTPPSAGPRGSWGTYDALPLLPWEEEEEDLQGEP